MKTNRIEHHTHDGHGLHDFALSKIMKTRIRNIYSPKIFSQKQKCIVITMQLVFN